MELGKRIKELRKRDRITQEKLADYLHISFQAISKWENGTAYPDIRLLPSIANFFNVSVDYLLENTEQEKQKEIDYVIRMYQELFNKGRLDEIIPLYEKTLLKYPNEYEIMLKLATTYVSIIASTHEHMKEEYGNRAVELCKKIVNDSKDFKYVDTATSILFYAYKALNDYKNAIEVAQSRPSMHYSKEVLLISAYTGNEANEYIQSYIRREVDSLSKNIFSLTYKLYGGDRYNLKEKILLTQKAIEILETVLYDENVSFLGIRLRRYYSKLAQFYAKDNQIENMYLALERARKLSIDYTDRPEKTRYTSLVLDTQVERRSDVYVNHPSTDFELYLEELKSSVFDKFKSELRFTQLTVEKNKENN